ncbi:MAG: hypothetical protein IPG85_09590 [Bacteroidetes bacterium]|nr:hypothetical protein [Bacteroidota bacterium]
MHEKLLTYGLKNSKLTHIDDVERGLKCNCSCPNCQIALIARKGKIKVHHFAHYRGADCGKAYETALHLLAKEIIKERKTIILPECYPSKNYYVDSRFKHPQRVINFSTIELEKQIAQDEITIKPDALCINTDYELLVEFAVTHFVDYEKLNKIRKLKKNCIEVDISNIELNKDKLIEVIENLPHHTKWIHNKHIEQDYRSFVEQHFIDTKNIIENIFKENMNFCIPNYINRKYSKKDFMIMKAPLF